MELKEYLARVSYRGSLEPTLATLRDLHRAHLLTIPYENLDIHLGRMLPLDEAEIFDKLVTRRRGGWCFEMNGLFAWALRELGFAVTLLGATVARVGSSIRKTDHLALLVALDEPYLCDVGFGDGLLAPLPLRAARYRQGFLDYELTRAGEMWRFHNQPHGAARGFSFNLEPRTLDSFAGMCHTLQTAPMSGFVRVTVCERFHKEGYSVLRGAVLLEVTAAGTRERVLEDAEDFSAVLQDRFGLELPEAHELWQRVWAGHLAWIEAITG